MSNVKGNVDVFSLKLGFDFGEGFIGELGDKSGNLGMNNFLNDSEAEIAKPKNGISAFSKKQAEPKGVMKRAQLEPLRLLED